MFEKILSLLPYNPSLLHQLSFYGRRMREEAAIRRTGTIFIVLAFLVQFFAVIAPPVSTVAYSTNDMINGGFTTQSEAVSTCRADTKNYGDVLADFGITCDDVAKASVVNPLSSTSHNDQLFSMGWLSQGPTNANTGKKTDEVALNLNKVSETLYARKLSSFDTYSHSDYKALEIHTSNGIFFILFSCGNLVTIQPPVPLPVPKPTPPPKPVPKVCPEDTSILASNTKCKSCSFDTTILKSNSKCVECPNPNHPGILKSNPMCLPVCPYNSSLDKSNPECKPCTAAISSQNKYACVAINKTAANITENISNADGTTAQPGDTIVYTLYATNQGKAAIKDYTGFEDNISDTLDYADVTDLHGGTIASDNEVTWPAVTIQPNTTATEMITVKVKDPIPQTPVDPADPGHFNLVMTNTFGYTTNIKLPGSPAKTVETLATTLPNTGPGAGLFVAALVMVVAGYFYSRSRLLATEAGLALHDTMSSGGL